MSTRSSPLGRTRGSAGLLLVAALAACGAPPAHRSSDPPDPALAASRAHLVEQLRAHGVADGRVLAAIGSVPRETFVPRAERARAYEDCALPIGHGQTISQPTVVAVMTAALGLGGGERVLEIGTGSGYQAAVLSQLARTVHTIEIDPALAETAAGRLTALGARNVAVRAGDGFYGWPEAAPFDAIGITAAAPRVPPALLEQLADGGRLVVPLEQAEGDQRLERIVRRGRRFEHETLDPVLFVPMRGAVRGP